MFVICACVFLVVCVWVFYDVNVLFVLLVVLCVVVCVCLRIIVFNMSV